MFPSNHFKSESIIFNEIQSLDQCVVSENTSFKCPNCGSTKILTYDQNKQCRQCLTLIETNSFAKSELSEKDKAEVLIVPSAKNQSFITGNRFNNRIKNQHIWKNIDVNERNRSKFMESLITKLKDKFSPHDTKIAIMNALDLFYNHISEYAGDRRARNKLGIIAMCIYYIFKEKGIIYDKKELAEKFDIDIRNITKGNKIINKLCMNNLDLRKIFNRIPISLDDMTTKINNAFTELGEIHLSNIHRIIYRIKDIEKVKINTSGPIIAGIIFKYISNNNVSSITSETIKKRLAVSESSIVKYSKYFDYAVYDMNLQSYRYDESENKYKKNNL